MHIIVGFIFAVSIASALVRSIQGYYNLVVNTKLTGVMSLVFFNHLQHLKIGFYDEHRVGEIVSRFGDVNNSINAINNVFQTVFVNGAYLLLVPPFLFILHWKLAVVSIISIPLTASIITYSSKYIRKYWSKAAEAYADLNAFQVEMLTHIRSLKALVLERHVYEKADMLIASAIKAKVKAGGLGYGMSFVNSVLYVLNTMLFTWLGWTYVLQKEMSLGDYLAFSAYLGYLYVPITELVRLFSEFQQSSVNLSRMFEYLDTPAEREPMQVYDDKEIRKKQINGDIQFKNISFGYIPDKIILHDINLSIKKGSITAILGPSGSGKTTLLRLLIALEKPLKGEILYGEINSKNFTLQDIRSQIATVWQEFSMFNGTIWDNLTIGLKNVDITEVKKATKISRIEDLIDSLPLGYDTPISEWGSTLSGGQRQRLTIARAIIRNSPVIVFDEATSNIDIQTETELLNEMFQQLRDKTIIIVTHRVASTRFADQICLLESGVITASGTPDELLNSNDTYRQMNEVLVGLQRDKNN
jgi:ABC-type bacteriocin/lantibiotic exporter with double-glycine peptidase domain